MARPIWTGILSFGLLNVPVALMSGERKVDLHFRMLDSRNNAPIRYERINSETGEEVPWKDIVKAFEYSKDSYVILKPEDIKSAAPESHETVEIDSFIPEGSISPQYYETPYILVPGKKSEKGYVLLRETLKKTRMIGIAKVVIRTREYLSAVMPHDDALLLMLLRYPQEIVEVSDHPVPTGKTAEYRITSKEFEMAQQLVESMAGKWQPENYRDEFRHKLSTVIQKRLKSKGLVTKPEVDEHNLPENAATNVVDFMSLLEKSLASNKRTPAKVKTSTLPSKKQKATSKRPAKKSGTRKSGSGTQTSSKKRKSEKPARKLSKAS
jgi:DNA end-binding protein Ku